MARDLAFERDDDTEKAETLSDLLAWLRGEE